ncbi:VWA domain-containing protein [Mariniblastus fucicola]|uniref:von Willebrand factor type A domain protein n=1 Tax=Mariniblastus fucicola TaxID=980251 RepID=A0A5B9PDB7_9BACT|nr:VWA domain-containing protein [Mariniblastus fucicola]QEG24687.1 von Willebrand factor type A domain protein [Mariniblastus fucicola]
MFHSPLWFLLMPVLLLAAWRIFGSRKGNAVRFSNTSLASQLTPSLRQRLLWLPKVLMLLALLFLIISLARPREGRDQTITESEGIAIEMVVDRSSSMQALDFKIEDEHVDRLTAIKNVAGKFVLGDESLDGRFSDLVGLITFAGYADGVTPPTLDHGFLASSLNNTQIVDVRSEDGTAIGDAIALAVEKLNALDENRDEKVKSKIMILLTDGENTAGELEPIAAAELAQTLGIKIYTIGIGTKGQAPIPYTDAFGRRRVQMMQVNIDESTLKKIAEVTEGKYFRATDTDSLTAIYEEIDQLEKTEVETENYVDYRELAVQPWRANGFQLPATLLISLSLLLVGVVLQHSWLREVS